ncbi:melanoma-derived growth regulatory protein isoform X2 [Emydura macquarii macquarii]|uniref:melanoma-derived growth regulatory protein isoform X2 n=1 Tax=Emydura macquarii macquarii TaxID=1129001 RepID=UPI00352A7BEA
MGQLLWALRKGLRAVTRNAARAGDVSSQPGQSEPAALGGCLSPTMANCRLWALAALLCTLPELAQGSRPLDKLAEKKLCADVDCSLAVQDYIAPDCRFIHIQRGQVVYVFSKLKGRGRLFWGGSVQGDYYGAHPARLGYFPSSVVQESQYLKPGKVEVKTDVSSQAAEAMGFLLPVSPASPPAPSAHSDPGTTASPREGKWLWRLAEAAVLSWSPGSRHEFPLL